MYKATVEAALMAAANITEAAIATTTKIIEVDDGGHEGGVIGMKILKFMAKETI